MTDSIRNVVLIGFMGTGKSTIGQVLAERLGWRFVDTDEAIVKQEGRTIPELFDSEGEAYFRNAETEMLRKTLTEECLVVSTGGGAVLRPENREFMLNSGFVIALTAPKEALLARLRGDANRPLLSGDKEERVHQLLEERRDAYKFAHLTIDTSIRNVRDTVDAIMKQAKLG